jgi:Single-strand binding protein family
MALTRIELSGRLLKPPVLGATPSGRAILRLSLDCGEEPELLPLEVIVMDEPARDLSRILRAGQRVSAVGSLRAVGRVAAGGRGRQQIEVIASEVRCGQPGIGLAERIDFSASRAVLPAKV